MGKRKDMIGKEQLRSLSRIAGKVNSVNLFSPYLTGHGYTQQERMLFAKGDSELIQVRQEQNHFTYVNHLRPGDKGGFINFLAIRMNNGVTGFSIDHYVKAAKVALKIYERVAKRLSPGGVKMKR
ncbi:hypothetical protein [Chitinophaga pinensis]|nr:hypothetical protein [Chitinophaga pinensis]